MLLCSTQPYHPGEGRGPVRRNAAFINALRACQTPAFAGVVILSLFLSACGFTPLYGNAATGTEAAVASNVEIANIPDREGQYLRNLLIDRLYLKGRPANAPYLLTLSPLKAELTKLGIRKDATSTRAMLQVSAILKLTDRATNQVVLERAVRAVGGYNQLDNQFATHVSRASVSDHMLEEMSDTIVTEVALYFSRDRAAQGVSP